VPRRSAALPAFDAAEFFETFDPWSLDLEASAVECERDLSQFYKEAWPTFDPAPWMGNWHIDCISDHLMAVTDGHIRKLLINVPFRVGKTAIVSVAWPAWTWAQRKRGPLSGPQVRFLTLSYASQLSLDNSTTAKRLLLSNWYQARWGHHVKIAGDQDSKERFDTTAGGSRISAGFDGATLGRGGDVKIIDDPHKVKEVESDLVREGVIRTYKEALASRVTDPRTSAEVTIMQRLGQGDLSGHIIEHGGSEVVHLMLPMEYDPLRHCVTVLRYDEDGEPAEIFQDPRGIDEDGELLPGIGYTKDGDPVVKPGSPMADADGALLWPERFTREAVDGLKGELGPYATAGQLQQAPTPRGGGIIKEEWWRLWDQPTFPPYGLSVVSLDTASTEKETNDESALTAFGTFADENARPNIMLRDGWEGHLEFDALVTRTIDMCRRNKADYLLVEGKANGIAVIQEIQRRMNRREWQVIQINPVGDKVNRALAVQTMWSGRYLGKEERTGIEMWGGGMMWAPDRDWAQLVIERCASFPKGKRKGIVDTVTQAAEWLRTNGVALLKEEHDEYEIDRRRYRKPTAAPYDV
jgi:phage terminase large subunit-like protein